MVLLIDLYGQASVLCSGDLASFEEYQPIMYPAFPRRAGVYGNFSYDLAIMPSGKFDYKLLDPIDTNSVAYQLQEAVLNSFPGWRFINNANGTINLKLKVVFELSGRVRMKDDIVKNQILFSQNTVTIKVTATQIIPNLVE